MRQPDHNALTDIHIVHTDSEWQLARAIARFLDARGYSVAPPKTLELPHRADMDTLPSDAAAVLVIWPMKRALFDKPALEARAAANSGRLIQIYAGAERPDESYAGPAPVDFSSWDYTPTSDTWRALMRRVRRLCGAPPKTQINVAATTQAVVLYSTLVLAVGSIFAVFMQDGQQRDVQEASTAPAPPIGSPEEEVMRSAIVVPPRLARANDAKPEPTTGLGGPEAYDTDLGVELAPPPPAMVAAPPEPAKRAPQNPPSALE